jgi:hypothetical protein
MDLKIQLASDFFSAIESLLLEGKHRFDNVRPKTELRIVRDNTVLYIMWRGKFITRPSKQFQVVLVQMYCCTLEEERVLHDPSQWADGQIRNNIQPQGIVTDVMSLVLMQLHQMDYLNVHGYTTKFITQECVNNDEYSGSLLRRGWVHQFDKRNDCLDLKLDFVRAMETYPEYQALIPLSPPPLSKEDATAFYMAEITHSLRKTIFGRDSEAEAIARFVADVTGVSMENALAAVASYDAEAVPDEEEEEEEY